jgi:hypothetical protein
MILNKKQRFFKAKIEEVTKTIWELEFKIAKSRQIREGIRQDRDRAVENKGHVAERLKNEKDKDKIKELEEEVVKNEENVKRYEAQMKMIDDQIQGSDQKNPSDEYPDGVPAVVGILEKIKSFTELRTMYKEYLKQI